MTAGVKITKSQTNLRPIFLFTSLKLLIVAMLCFPQSSTSPIAFAIPYLVKRKISSIITVR